MLSNDKNSVTGSCKCLCRHLLSKLASGFYFSWNFLGTFASDVVEYCLLDHTNRQRQADSDVISRDYNRL